MKFHILYIYTNNLVTTVFCFRLADLEAKSSADNGNEHVDKERIVEIAGFRSKSGFRYKMFNFNEVTRLLRSGLQQAVSDATTAFNDTGNFGSFTVLFDLALSSLTLSIRFRPDHSSTTSGDMDVEVDSLAT